MLIWPHLHSTLDCITISISAAHGKLTFEWFFVFQMKKELSDNESISQEIVGNAHVENYAIKMFLYADNEDRSGRFHK